LFREAPDHVTGGDKGLPPIFCVEVVGGLPGVFEERLPGGIGLGGPVLWVLGEGRERPGKELGRGREGGGGGGGRR
jgi:hypothetical protein